MLSKNYSSAETHLSPDEMQDHSHLTRLPLETIQQIGSLLPARTILSLGQTCRYLRIACHDPVVLRNSFITYADYPSDTVVLPDKEELHSLISAQLATETGQGSLHSASTWTHLAFAASQMCPPSSGFIDALSTLLAPFSSISGDNLNESSSSPTPECLPAALVNFVGALSNFTIFGLPVPLTASVSGLAVQLSYSAFFRAQSATNRDTLAAQVALCLAAGSLQAADSVVPEAVNNSDSNMPLLTQRVASAFGFREVALHLNDDGEPDDESAITADWCVSLEGGQTIGLLAVACVVHMLRADEDVQERDDFPCLDRVSFLSAKKSNLKSRMGTERRTVHIPLPEGSVGVGVLWANSLGTALRGYGAAAAPEYARWLRENLDALIEDLPNGEWVGYYTYGAEGDDDVDAPLQGIHFTTEADPDDGDAVLVRAQGCRDGIGEFELNGTISRRGGWVALRKSYAFGPSWANQAWLTPLGIAGYWGGRPGIGDGFVWMYKREWTNEGQKEPAKQRTV